MPTRLRRIYLQAVWQHQRIRRDELKTAEGTPIRILHPGFRSVEGGPDFRGAVIQIGNETPKSGDVEVDIRASGWRAHGHYINKAFTNVILHVIWGEERSTAGGPPTIALRNALDAPIGELNLWLGTEAAQEFPEMLRGKCCAPLRELDETATLGLLREAAKVRLQSKASQFQARARQAGWGNLFGKGYFARLATNIIPGRCSDSQNCGRAGPTIAKNLCRCRPGYWVSAACCRLN